MTALVSLIGLSALSAVIWLIIEKFKPLWEEIKHGKYITIAIALVLCMLTAFTIPIDLFIILGYMELSTNLGIVFGGLSLVAGSTVIDKFIQNPK